MHACSEWPVCAPMAARGSAWKMDTPGCPPRALSAMNETGCPPCALSAMNETGCPPRALSAMNETSGLELGVGLGNSGHREPWDGESMLSHQDFFTHTHHTPRLYPPHGALPTRGYHAVDIIIRGILGRMCTSASPCLGTSWHGFVCTATLTHEKTVPSSPRASAW